MSIVLSLTNPCELNAGVWLLRLPLIGLLIVNWGAYRCAYPEGGAQTPRLKALRPWRMRPRAADACEACQKGLSLQIFRARTDVVPYRAMKSTCGRRKTLNTAGHACPNPACAYFAVTDETLHAVVGNGKRGSTKTFRIGSVRPVRRNSPADYTRPCTA